MSKIQATIGGKAKGIADQVCIDPALGCKNKCTGCYAHKSCQRGKYYDTAIEKDFDKEFLKRSINKAERKGYHVARVGKHCDPGDHINSLNNILDCCSDESFGCVVVSKSLPFIDAIASNLIRGKHLLHMSIGPYSSFAPSESARLRVAGKYLKGGAKVAIRWTRNVTEDIDKFTYDNIGRFPYIITPMRYPSMKTLLEDEADPDKFEYKGGYYRPTHWHGSWFSFRENVCGEVGNEVLCCNCLLGTSTMIYHT